MSATTTEQTTTYLESRRDVQRMASELDSLAARLAQLEDDEIRAFNNGSVSEAKACRASRATLTETGETLCQGLQVALEAVRQSFEADFRPRLALAEQRVNPLRARQSELQRELKQVTKQLAIETEKAQPAIALCEQRNSEFSAWHINLISRTAALARRLSNFVR